MTMFDLIVSMCIQGNSIDSYHAIMNNMFKVNRGMFAWKLSGNFSIPVVIPAQMHKQQNSVVMVDFMETGSFNAKEIQ